MKTVFELDVEELDLLREWYGAIRDLSPSYLGEKDHALGLWIEEQFKRPAVRAELLKRQAAQSA